MNNIQNVYQFTRNMNSNLSARTHAVSEIGVMFHVTFQSFTRKSMPLENQHRIEYENIWWRVLELV